MIIQTIEVCFNIHAKEVQGGIPDMVVEQYELNYLKDHMDDCVSKAIYQYGEGNIGYSQLRQRRSLHYTVSHIPTFEDAQTIEAMLVDIAEALLLEIGDTE